MRFRQMKMQTHRLMALSCGLAVAVAGVTGCGGGGSEPNAPPLSAAATTAVVVVTPSTSKLSVGSTIPLQAQAQDASGQVVRDVSIFWSSRDTTIATVSAIGVVTARAVGTVQIAASAAGKSAVAILSIVPVPVASVTVLPGQGTVPIGVSLSLRAVAYTDAGGVLTGRQVLWATSAPQIATVDGGGNVKGVAAGTVTITATSEGKSGAATIVVSAAAQTPPPGTPTTPAPVASVTVLPAQATVAVGGLLPLSAVAYSDAGAVLTGRQVLWATSAPQIATVDGGGNVKGVAAGTVTITATSEGKAGNAQITVTVPAPDTPTPPTPAPVGSVTVSPASLSLTVGQTESMSALTRDADQKVLTGRAVSWASENTAVAAIDGSGSVISVRAVGAGSTTITATSEGKTGRAPVTVTVPAPVPVASVAVNPNTGTITVGGTLSLSATTSDASGGTLSGRNIVWSSDAPQVATVSSSGVVTAVGAGSAVISASSEGKSGSAAITVQPVPVASVAVSPSTGTVDVGGTLALSASTLDASGGTLSGRAVTWSSSASQVATVSSSGVVTAAGAGSATITATSEGQSGSAAITVPAPSAPAPKPVASIVITPPTAAIRKGESVNLVAQLSDANGNVLTGRTVQWSINDGGNSVLSITSTGSLTATATAKNKTGSATVVAAAEGKQGTSVIIVVNP